MNINSDMALIPVSHDLRPARNVAERGVSRYSEPNDNLVRISFSEPRLTRVGNTYDRFGAAKDSKNSVGENIDMYV